MSFKKFKTIDEVLVIFQLTLKRDSFVKEISQLKMPSSLSIELDYALNNIPYKTSETAIRENIMYPILKEVFKIYDDTLMIWSNKTITFDKDLGGIPDYLITKQSPLGKVVFGSPLLAVVEAKKDDFEGGWAQCLLEMYTIQKINNRPEIPVFGIVSNGDFWEFGRLLNSQFVYHHESYTLSQRDMLFSVINTFFYQCKQNAEKL
jgi:hypothetical protein